MWVVRKSWTQDLADSEAPKRESSMWCKFPASSHFLRSYIPTHPAALSRPVCNLRFFRIQYAKFLDHPCWIRWHKLAFHRYSICFWHDRRADWTSWRSKSLQVSLATRGCSRKNQPYNDEWMTRTPWNCGKDYYTTSWNSRIWLQVVHCPSFLEMWREKFWKNLFKNKLGK